MKIALNLHKVTVSGFGAVACEGCDSLTLDTSPFNPLLCQPCIFSGQSVFSTHE